MAIPESELERLAPNASTAPRVDLETGPVPISDEKLGIKKVFGGLRQNGEYPARFTVPGYEGRFSTGEMESYRAAFRAIASELESATQLREQLKDATWLSDFAEAEIESPQIGR